MITFGTLTILSELTIRVKQNLELSCSINLTQLIWRRPAAIRPPAAVPLRALTGAPSSRACPACPERSRREPAQVVIASGSTACALQMEHPCSAKSGCATGGRLQTGAVPG